MTKRSSRRLRQWVALSVVLTFVFASTHAHAADGDSEWYGGQIMAADAAAIVWVPFVLLLGSLSGDHIDTEYLAPVALAGYALGSPIIHLAHRQWWQASASFGMRMGLPIGGAFLATKLSDESGYGAIGPVLLGVTAGLITALAVDYIFLANHPISPQTDTGSKTQMLQIQWRF